MVGHGMGAVRGVRECGGSGSDFGAGFVGEGRGEVAFAGGAGDGDDEFAGVFGSGGDLESGVDVGSGGDACEDAFFFGEAACHGEGVVVGDLDDFGDDGEVEVIGDEASAGALDFVRGWDDGVAGEGLGDDWAGFWFDGDGGEGRFVVAERAGDAGDGAAGADGGDEDVDVAAGIVPDFLGGGFFVDGGVGGLLNCWGIHAPGVAARISSAFSIAPFMPLGPGVRTSSAPSMARSVRRSSDMVSGMVRMSL
jgi:hypothetical protein